jgi:ketosteroid isomerase-like protein
MSKIYDQLISIESQNSEQYFARKPVILPGTHQETDPSVTDEIKAHNSQFQTDDLSIQTRLHTEAIDKAKNRLKAETSLTKELVAQRAEEMRLASLASKRALAEKEERAALIVRLEAERQLANHLAARIEQESFTQAQILQRAAHEKKLKSAIAERAAQERQLQLDELATQAFLQQQAIDEARKIIIETQQQVEEFAVLQKEEARLQSLAQERVITEQAAQESLAMRIDAERKLTTQIEARIEQEKLEHAQSIRRAVHEEQLRMAINRRLEQECQSRIEELNAQARSQETAIQEARKRADEEIRHTEFQTSLLAGETRLAVLAGERALIEQAERESLAKRIEVERQLTARVEARIEQEFIESEQAVFRTRQEEKLRTMTAEREEQERRLQAEECAVHRPEPDVQATRTNQRKRLNIQTLPVKYKRRTIFYGLALLVIGAGICLAFYFDFFLPPPRADKFSANDTNVSQVGGLPISVEQTGLQPQVETEIRQMIAQWVGAWSRRDASAYLSFYAADFALPEGMQRAEWAAQRQSRLAKYHLIEVNLSTIKINYHGGDTATARFYQDFRADNYRETGTKKELLLKNVQGQWLIVSEQSF